MKNYILVQYIFRMFIILFISKQVLVVNSIQLYVIISESIKLTTFFHCEGEMIGERGEMR